MTPEERFTCAACGGTFAKTGDDDAAHQEAERTFGRRGDAADMVLVCGPCYREILEWEDIHPEIDLKDQS